METAKAESELEKMLEDLTNELSAVEGFLSAFGHEAKNYITPVPGFAIIALSESFQLGANFNRDLYIKFLEDLLEREKLYLPEFVEVPEKMGELELTTMDGSKVETIDDLKTSWLGQLTEGLLSIHILIPDKI